MKLTLHPIILSLFILLIINNLYAANQFDPTLTWKSIKTDHFWIHYHQGLEKIALQMAKTAEDVHKRLIKDVSWEPYFRTDIVLVDNMDSANGYATPFPYNKIQIYISRPELDSELNNFNKWLELVFIHEYTHILNLDTINGVPKITRYLFGRVYFPNLLLPVWMIEGNAVYQESLGTVYGRNNSTYTDMILRTEVLSNQLKSISKASHFPREWPRGMVPYLYGGLFIKFLEEKYGKDTIAKAFQENSDNIIPFLINKNAYDVYNKSFITLWDEWMEYIKIKYSLQIKEISRHEISQAALISNKNDNSTLPKFSRDGKSIYFIQSSDRFESRLVQYIIEDKKIKNLCTVNYPNSIAVSSKGILYLSDLEYYRSFSLYNEAFKYEKGYKQVSTRLRGSYIDLFKNDKECIYVKNDLNAYSMVISSLDFKQAKAIIENSNIQIAYPRISPDEKKIIFTCKDLKGNSDLILLHLDTMKFIRLTNDVYNDIEPVWHPDNNRIVFSSDRNGIYNLYEYNINQKTINRITNVITGAFSPDISPDGSYITFSTYEPKGHIIQLLEYTDKVFSSEKTVETELPDNYFSRKDDAIENTNDNDVIIKNYSPLPTIFPLFYIPVLPLFATEEYANNRYDGAYGIMTYGHDALQQHSYSIMAYIYQVQKRAVIDMSYTYSKFYPDITIGYYDETYFIGKDKFPWDKYSLYKSSRELDRQGFISIVFPFLRYKREQYLQFSYIYDNKYIDTSYPGYNISPALLPTYQYVRHRNKNLSRVQGSYYFNNSKMYPYSISNEDGREFQLTAELFHTIIGSADSFAKIRGEYSEYLPGFFLNNVFMLRLRGGITIHNPSYLTSYDLGRYEKGYFDEPATGVDAWGLRGYPSDRVYGTKITAGTAEYRFPILQADAGYNTIPIMFRDLWLNIFFDYGNVFNGKVNFMQFKSSAGAELHMRITLGYWLDITGYIGYARGFNKYGENQVYFAISTFIEGTFKNNRKRLD